MTISAPGVNVQEVPGGIQPIAGVGTSTAAFIGVDLPNSVNVPRSNPDFDPTEPVGEGNRPYVADSHSVVAAGEIVLCTTFSDFTAAFGGFSTSPNQRLLAHAVYGFFQNGGSRCFVVRAPAAEVADVALAKLEAIDEVAVVCAPGVVDDGVRGAIVSHCATRTQDRFAVFDGPRDIETNNRFDPQRLDPGQDQNDVPDTTDYAAFYVPWIEVFDPATKIQDPTGSGRVHVPPSGHVAGVYARVDTERGVHKAPANEMLRGALGVRYRISRAVQEGLNPQGVNAIRDLNGSIRVWGARTIGGDRNGEWKYVNVRRLFLFLRESLDEGLQWTVFEPNDPSLWGKIRRNCEAFLLGVWRDGALFGTTPQEAFYVKCDAETNPPDVREQGRVVTEIGVAVVKPAEFVIIKLSQWAGPEA